MVRAFDVPSVASQDCVNPCVGAFLPDAYYTASRPHHSRRGESCDEWSWRDRGWVGGFSAAVSHQQRCGQAQRVDVGGVRRGVAARQPRLRLVVEQRLHRLQRALRDGHLGFVDEDGRRLLQRLEQVHRVEHVQAMRVRYALRDAPLEPLLLDDLDQLRRALQPRVAYPLVLQHTAQHQWAAPVP
jgi:hypothetical protein